MVHKILKKYYGHHTSISQQSSTTGKYRIFLTAIVLSEREGHTWKKVVTFIFHLDKCMYCCAEGYIPVIKASDKQVLNFCQLLLKITEGIKDLVWKNI